VLLKHLAVQVHADVSSHVLGADLQHLVGKGSHNVRIHTGASSLFPSAVQGKKQHKQGWTAILLDQVPGLVALPFCGRDRQCLKQCVLNAQEMGLRVWAGGRPGVSAEETFKLIPAQCVRVSYVKEEPSRRMANTSIPRSR
jgi:hypothetical protein